MAPNQIPTGQISFAPLGTAPFDYKLAIKITLADGTSQTYNYKIGANTDPQSINNLVLASLPQTNGKTSGYKIKVNANGTGFSISGYFNDNNNTTTNYKALSASISKGTTNQAPAKPPSISETAGTGGGGSGMGSTPLAFSFAPSLIDGTQTLQDATSIQATIDGQVETLNEQAGVSFTQVADDLYNLLVAAGLKGVSLNGDEVILTEDFSGAAVSTIQIDASDSSGGSMNWIALGVDTL